MCVCVHDMLCAHVHVMLLCDNDLVLLMYYTCVVWLPCTVKKTGPRGVRFEGCYSPGCVMATHKGIQLTSMGVGRLWRC